MPRRLLVAIVLVVAVVLAGGRAAASAGSPAEPPPPPDTVATNDNAFLPVDEQLSECVSALPPPSCGSEARGGWRQVLVVVVIGAALALIGSRVVRTARRRAHRHEEVDA